MVVAVKDEKALEVAAAVAMGGMGMARGGSVGKGLLLMLLPPPPPALQGNRV